MRKQEKKIRKVLIVIASYSSYRSPLEKALKVLNIKTNHFDNRKTTLYEKLFFALSKIYPLFYSFATSHINNRLLKKIGQFRPDLVIVSKGENILPETVRRISKKTIIVNWFTDYFADFKGLGERISAYNVFFTGDRTDVKSYRKKGYKNLYCLPYAGPSLNPEFGKKKYDVVFIGTFNKTRERLFDNLDQLNLKIWGDKKWKKSKLKNNYMGKWLSFDEMMQILKNSKIVINNHQNRVLNMRVYETTAAGALLITDYSPDLPLMYKIGREIVVYKNKNDLYKKVKYYLERDIQREKIAIAGCIRVKKEHNYPNRLRKMFSVVVRLQGTSTPY